MRPNLRNDKWFLRQVKTGWLSVSKKGKIINLKTGKILGSKKPKEGKYVLIGLYDKNEGKTRYIQAHRLVWLTYRGLIPPKIQINHKNGIKHYNRLSNLELATNQENTKHAYDTGLTKRKEGEANHNALLSNKKVLIIREKFATGRYTIKFIANKLDVSCDCIRKILKGDRYFNVGGPIKECKKLVRLRSNCYNLEGWKIMQKRIENLKLKGLEIKEISNKLKLSEKVIRKLLDD